MPMPKINDLLPAFFDVLADGNVHSHQEIWVKLALRFRLTDDELLEVTAKGLPRFVNLVAWCKAYATMAAFTEQTDSEGIQITSLGLADIKYGTKHITAQYLKSHQKSLKKTPNTMS